MEVYVAAGCVCHVNLRQCHHLGMDRILKTVSHTFKWNTLHDWVKEAFHDQFFGFFLWNAAAEQIKHLIRINFADRGAMRAAHIIRLDLQPRESNLPGCLN